MPANLAAASPTLILPNALATAFVETLSYPMLSVGYHDKTIERSLITDGVNPARVLRTWKLARRLTTAQLAVMRSFWVAVGGGLRAFFAYPNPRDYDATGSSPIGKVTVVFAGNWSQSVGLALSDVPFELLEVA